MAKGYNVRRTWPIAVCSAIAIAVAAIFLVNLGVDSARSDNPNPTYPPDKQLAIDSEQNGRREALENPPSPDATKNEEIVEQTNAPLPLGINPAVDIQIPGYVFSNLWRKSENGQYLTVYAGKADWDASRGLLLVWAATPGQPFPPSTRFWTEPGTGFLTIDDADGDLLSIHSKDGTTYMFDAAAGSLTHGDGSPITTDSPTPTLAPETSPEFTLPPFDFNSATPTVTPTAAPSATFAQATVGVGG
jgi:hypothetical protein